MVARAGPRPRLLPAGLTPPTDPQPEASLSAASDRWGKGAYRQQKLGPRSTVRASRAVNPALRPGIELERAPIILRKIFLYTNRPLCSCSAHARRADRHHPRRAARSQPARRGQGKSGRSHPRPRPQTHRLRPRTRHDAPSGATPPRTRATSAPATSRSFSSASPRGCTALAHSKDASSATPPVWTHRTGRGPRRPSTSRAPPSPARQRCASRRHAHAEQIAAQVRRRPIGAVIADICRDLGIMPNHPLWPELSEVIVCHGGNLVRLVKDIITQATRTISQRWGAGMPSSRPRRLCQARPTPAPTRPDASDGVISNATPSGATCSTTNGCARTAAHR